MSTQPTADFFDPHWDMADRLQKALRLADMTGPEMASFLDVHRNTLRSWLTGKTTPNHRTLLLWSMKTGAPLAWLEHGDEAPMVRRQGLEPRTRWLSSRHLYAVS
jgi:transcriptional regulator with XRE-family HTH domain